MKLWQIILIAFISFFPNHLFANKIFTVADGNWEDSTVWLNGNPPGYSFNDTIEIKHCIFYNENLQLNYGAFLTIQDSGKICGHHNIYSKPGSEFDVFGRIYFDTLFNEGYWYINNNNQAWIGLYWISYSYASFLFVGPAIFTNSSFTCSCEYDSIPPLPHDTFTVVNDSFGIEIEVYPNPFNEIIHIKTNAVIDIIYLTDDRGRLILRRKYEEEYVDLRHLLPASYFLNLILTNGQTITKKIIKL
jgi:hypothetical protein